jgi:hypothetical protein
MRSRFAMRFAKEKDEFGREVTREDQLRLVFTETWTVRRRWGTTLPPIGEHARSRLHHSRNTGHGPRGGPGGKTRRSTFRSGGRCGSAAAWPCFASTS